MYLMIGNIKPPILNVEEFSKDIIWDRRIYVKMTPTLRTGWIKSGHRRRLLDKYIWKADSNLGIAKKYKYFPK